MRKLTFLSILLFYSPFVFAQQFVVDSLLRLQETETDPIRQIDLHLGLSRAYGFIGDNVAIEKQIKAIHQLSKTNNYPEGDAIALLFEGLLKDNTGGDSEIAYEFNKKALAIAQAIPSKSVEAMAQYHIAEYFIYEKNDYTKGIEILTQTIEKSDETVADKHLGNCYKNLALAYQIQYKNDLAIVNFEKAIQYFDRVKTHPFIVPKLGRPSTMDADQGLMNKGQIHLYLSRSYNSLGNKEKTLEHLTIAKQIYESTQSYSYVAWVLEDFGRAYNDFGMKEKAIESLQQSIKIYEKLESEVDLAYSNFELGSTLADQKEYKAAEKYLFKSLENAKLRTDTILLQRAHRGLGFLYSSIQDWNKALVHHIETEKITTAIQDSSFFAATKLDLASVFFKRGEFKKALTYSHQALKWSTHFEDLTYSFYTYSQLATIHNTLNQPDSALHFMELAAPFAQKTNFIAHKMKVQQTYSDIFEKQGNYKKAFNAQKEYFALYQKNYSSNAQAKLKEEQVRQDVVSIEKEKDLAEREATFLANQNKIYLTLAIGLISILVIGFYLFNQLRKVKLQLESQNLQLQQLNATKDKFFGIIAHDIRSPIVALDGVGEQMQYYLKKNKPEKLERLAGRIDSTAKRLSSLLDNLLNWALLQQGVIPYHPKALNVQEVGNNILQMFQDNADAKNITLNLQIDKDIKVHADESALNTILRNLVSNAIKFTPKGGNISLSTETKDNKVFINVNDTGTGISAEKLSKLFSLEKTSEKGTAGEKGTGLGLTLVKELTELNQGSINVNSVLTKGSNFKISLPIAA